MKMRTGNIYGLIDGNTLELRYIGQTFRSLEVRLKQHKQGRGPNPHLNRWLRVKFVNIIMLECDPADINEAEIRWIKEMKKRGIRLINLTDGGGGTAGYTHTLETRDKISTKMRTVHTLEQRAKISIKMMGKQNALGYRHTDEARAKMSVALMGHSVSIETRAKISAAMIKFVRRYAPM